MLFDTHTHVIPWSHDASQKIEELLADATEKKLAGVCLTDHYEKDMFYERGYEDIFDPDEYFSELKKYRYISKDYQNDSKLSFLIGAELGWLPHLNEHLAALVKNYPFDSIILSLHVLDKKDPYVDADFFDQGLEITYKKAIERMHDMITSCPDYDILGHFDYISRYAKSSNNKMKYEHAPEAFDRLFKTMIATDKCLEINTRTTVKLRETGYSKENSFPDEKIFQRYLELGGKYISISSDSHHYGHAALIFDEMKDWLLSQNIDKLTYFVERKPVLYSIT